MDTFSAVVTTGIYCRPNCSAQPQPGHVRRFSLAAAAEAAGYRACLRCRPYRVPPSLPSTGPEIVCRAVHLILDGALDERTETQLAARMAVSARHLRRLFEAHLGATPDGLARSARAHFARRLLDDTDLTITEIAFATGFGSLRQFNRACQNIFRASPQVLRAKRRRADRLVADGGLMLRLPFRGALDWQAMAGYLAARAAPGVERVTGDVYRRTIVIGGDPGVLELAPGGDDHLLLRLHLPHWEELTHIASRARRIAGLDVDPGDAARVLGRDAVIGRLLRARPGLRVPGTWDPFETGVRAIIGQQVTLSAANSFAGRLVASLGMPVPGLTQMGLTHAFPTPRVLASADLGGMGLTGAKRRAISHFAHAVEDDALRLDRSISLDRLVASLDELPGLGPWTAHYLALRLGEPDACPIDDLGLRRSLARLIGRSNVDARAVVDRWRPWRALATVHLWMADAAPPAPGVRQGAA